MVKKQSVVDALDQLAKLQDRADELGLEKQRKIDKIMRPIQKELDKIMGAPTPELDKINRRIEELKSDIGEAVVETGSTITGSRLQGVMMPGRVTWDNKALDGYAVANPDVLKFRKQGNPFCVIRPVSKVGEKQ